MGRSRKGRKSLNNSKKDLLEEEEKVDEEEEEPEVEEEEDVGGETNLGYAQDASDIIKSKSKEDVRTIRRNLSRSKGDGQKKKISKKKAKI